MDVLSAVNLKYSVTIIANFYTFWCEQFAVLQMLPKKEEEKQAVLK
jgi:hypothetical protein